MSRLRMTDLWVWLSANILPSQYVISITKRWIKKIQQVEESREGQILTRFRNVGWARGKSHLPGVATLTKGRSFIVPLGECVKKVAFKRILYWAQEAEFSCLSGRDESRIYPAEPRLGLYEVGAFASAPAGHPEGI